jgi:hypothetical protein
MLQSKSPLLAGSAVDGWLRRGGHDTQRGCKRALGETSSPTPEACDPGSPQPDQRAVIGKGLTPTDSTDRKARNFTLGSNSAAVQQGHGQAAPLPAIPKKPTTNSKPGSSPKIPTNTVLLSLWRVDRYHVMAFCPVVACRRFGVVWCGVLFVRLLDRVSGRQCVAGQGSTRCW